MNETFIPFVLFTYWSTGNVHVSMVLKEWHVKDWNALKYDMYQFINYVYDYDDNDNIII